MATPPLIEHVGWRLWRASQQWMRRFSAEMVEAGYPVFAEARAQLIPHIAREGSRQSELVARMGLSKQAVQQLIAGLEDDGLVERLPDLDDRRGKVVAFTPQGLALLAAANEVKKRIEKDYRARLGTERFAQLMQALDLLDSPG
jgi:DNA-binding MarR family transcriptional regulator